MSRFPARSAWAWTAVVALATALPASAANIQLTWANQAERPSIGAPVDTFEMTAKLFEQANPGVTVNVTYGRSWVTQMAAGEGPDLVGDCCTTLVNTGTSGGFVDLTPFLGTVLPDYMKEQMFWAPQWSAFQDHRGHQFALPLYLGTIGMYANVDMFQAAGLPVPSADLGTNHQDWNAFEAICKKLTQTDASGRITQTGFVKSYGSDRFGYWLLAAGAQYYAGGDRAKSALASPQAVEALTYLQRLKNTDKCMSSNENLFYNGQAAIMEEGSWKLGYVIGADATGKRKVPFKAQVFPMPIGPSGHRATLATIDGLAVNRATKHLDQAIQLLKLTAGKQAEEIRAKYNGMQPARKDVVPEFLNLMDAINHQSFKVDAHVFTDAGPYAYPQYLYSNQQVADSLLRAAISKILNEDAPVQNTWYASVDALNGALAQLSQPERPHEAVAVTFDGDDFTSQDINTLTYGSTTVSSGALKITGDSRDIWGTADGFRYAWHKVSGDFTAVVQLDQAPTTYSWSKAGIMVRQSADPSAAQMMVCGTDKNGIRIQYRPVKAGKSSDIKGPAWNNGTPVWLKLVRKGSTLTGYASADGKNWTKIGAPSGMQLGNDPVLIGLASSSGLLGMQGSATFKDWSLQHTAE